MEVLQKAQQRRDAGIPEWGGFYHDPYYLPGRRAGENILDFLARAPQDVRQYCRDLARWTRKHPQLAPPGAERLVRAIDTRTRK